MAFLVPLTDEDKEKRYPLPADREIILGRGDDVDIVLQDRNASRRHARFSWVEGQPVLVDLGSSNGTLVNDLPISQITLLDGDVVGLGEESFRFVEDGPPRKARHLGGLRLKPGSGTVRAVAPPDVTTQLLQLGSQAEQMDALYDTYLKLKTLYRALQGLGAAETTDELYRVAAESILLSTRCDRVAIIMQDNDGKLIPAFQLWSRELRENDIKEMGGDDVEAIDEDAIKEIVEKRAPVIFFAASDEDDDVEPVAVPADEENGEDAAVALPPSRSGQALGAPILRAGSLTGAIYADSPITGLELSKNDLDLVATMATQMADPLGRVRTIERLQKQQNLLADGSRGQHALITRANAMKPILQMIRQAAPTDSNILLRGESGTGKELLARAVHNLSSRREGAFIPVNCAALPENLIESELFGHEKGAFTGAFTRRPGKFEAADGGTIFLDEIGELPLVAQSKLLRVLQESEIQRIGSVKSIKVDARVVCATNVDLEAAVKKGEFREDLYYRINVVAITVPPLRERYEDIQVLADYYLDYFSKKIPNGPKEISPEALQAMAQYSWPGNVRELRNVIERAVVLCTGPAIMPSDLPMEIGNRMPSGLHKATVDAEMPTEDATICSLADMEKRHIQTVLDITQGNKQQAAKLLGISRTTLYEKIKNYELN